MTPVRTAALVAALLVVAGSATGMSGDAPFVAFEPRDGALALVAEGVAAPVVVDGDDHPGVRRAAGDLAADVERVTGRKPAVHGDVEEVARDARSYRVVVVGTLGRSAAIDSLVRTGKLDVRAIEGRWEAFVSEIVDKPLPAIERALVIAGSDPRGTIYGIYDLSQQIGVSPWYWWADVPVERHEALYVLPGRRVDDGPAVKYRGIFLNDEAPALAGWAQEKFGGAPSSRRSQAGTRPRCRRSGPSTRKCRNTTSAACACRTTSPCSGPTTTGATFAGCRLPGSGSAPAVRASTTTSTTSAARATTSG
jgi:hypothetical protein